MKSMGSMLLRENPFAEIVMGNTALVRGMVEAGTRVVTSYPGSPTPEIVTAIKSIPAEKRPFYFEFSVNEKVATEVAYGAAVNGHLSTVFFKSVGLNVASDTFVQLSLMNIIGGMVIILGDDPGANSSQNEQDNLHLARMSYTPVLEPADPSEAYRMYRQAADLSRDLKMPVILRMTTHVCHAKQKVSFDGWQPAAQDNTPRFDSKNGPYIPLTAEVFPKKRLALKRLAQVAELADSPEYNRMLDNGNPGRGVITMGLPFLSLMDVLADTAEPPDVLKVGFAYPLPRETIKQFLRSHQSVKILEELDDGFEKDVKTIAFDEKIDVDLIGKMDDEDWIGEYTPDKVRDIMMRTWQDLLPEKAATTQAPVHVTARPAQMCPGCGHRSAFHAIKKALVDSDITVADIGCHTLGYLPPYQVGELLMCMGASPGMAAGLSLFNNTRRVVAFLGDSTFFHAGLPGIINALFNRHNITLVVMENGTTAMTGHQDHAAAGRNFNAQTDKIPIRSVLEGFGIEHIFETDTYQQAKLTELMEQALKTNGFSVVIARHPCMLKFTREQRRKPAHEAKMVRIDQQTCSRIYNCIETFACPTFTRGEDGSIHTNPDLCIGDGSCIQTCPSSAIQKPSNKNSSG